jgi:translation initiation factor 1
MDSSLVYSTEHGRMCPGCAQPVDNCACGRANRPLPKTDGIVRVSRETKGRKGKCVTLVNGIPLDNDGLLALAKQFKQRCGSGGTVKENCIEIQGDHRDVLAKELAKLGYTVKKSG